MKFTKARLATHVSVIVLRAAVEASEISRGMWNPMFCDDDASKAGQRFCEDMQRYVDNIRARINLKEPTP